MSRRLNPEAAKWLGNHSQPVVWIDEFDPLRRFEYIISLVPKRV